MKTSVYYSNVNKSSEFVNEFGFEILDNEKLGKIRGGIFDPDPK